jgi:hypothetical protein
MLKYRYEVPFVFTGTISKLSFHLEPEQVKEAGKPLTEEDGNQLKSISDSVSNEEN